MRENMNEEKRKELIKEILNMAYCSYNGDCMADKEKCYKCSDYVIKYADIEKLLTE